MYALYRGDELLCMGSLCEIATKCNIKIDSVRYYLTPAYQRKLKKRKNGKYERQRVLIKID